MPVETLIDTVTQYLFSLLCHQDPSILTHIEGKTLYLCPRCIGLHIGCVIGFLFIRTDILRMHRFGSGQIILLILLTSLPALHWFFGAIDVIHPDQISRFITGSVGGAAFGVCVMMVRKGSSVIHSEFQTKNLDTIIAGCIIGMSILTLAWGVWGVVSLVLFIIVLFNEILIGNTLARLFYKRFKIPHHSSE